ncbi:type II secretion system protein GspL [Uliginosibacterium gangwonense]|uniref:type II secretion system protein GspL n=1 Tax=Uliginosibacterium gangwonense TaxID=392736 RepID=UPI0003A7A9F7|nr:type II secretion system protein GspL [Uliginosibacterium gangwonense]
MTTLLRVLLGEHWPDQPTAHWVVMDERGKVINSGVDEPRNWPKSNRTEAILHGPQTSWFKIKVPKAGVREQAQALGFAIEEQIVREADSQHSTPTAQEDEHWHVIVIARERLKRLVAQFETISRPLDAAYSALQTVPVQADAWVVAFNEDGVVVRSGEHEGWAEDMPASGEVPALLSIALTQNKEAGGPPARLLLSAAKTEALLKPWSEQLGVSVESTTAWAWYAAASDWADLLHGEFQPRHRRKAWRRALRPALVGLSVVFAIHLLWGTAYAWWRRAELNHINASMEQLMRTQLPNDPVLDPAAQIQRELNMQRSRHGLLANDAALSLMADFAAALGPDGTDAVKNLRYQDGSLELSVEASKINLDTIRTRVQARGLTVSQREGDGKIVIRRGN